jgi:hypothetical protein
MGCAVQLHKSSERQGTWAENTTNGWYIQTSPEHYCCHKIHVKKTNSERVSDTVFFKHKYITQPTLTLADILTKVIDDLTHAWSHVAEWLSDVLSSRSPGFETFTWQT